MPNYTLLLNIDTSSISVQSRQVYSSEIDCILEDLKSTEGVLWLNDNAWLFALDDSREIYDQAVSTLEELEFEYLVLELSDKQACTLLESDSNERALVRIRNFFEKD